MLPPAVNDRFVRIHLDQILPVNTNYLWISGVPAADWLAVAFNTLDTAGEDAEDANDGAITDGNL